MRRFPSPRLDISQAPTTLSTAKSSQTRHSIYSAFRCNCAK
jgi:hypothetical protein